MTSATSAPATRPRVLSCSWHSYFDPSSGASHSLRDLLELLAARGWDCRALCAAHLDYDVPAKYTPESREVPTAEEMSPWVDTILRLYDDEAFYQEQRRRCRAAAQVWRPEVIGDRYEAFLRRVLAG